MAKRVSRAGRKYPRRKLWVERRDAAFARAGDRCEVTGDSLLIHLAPNKYAYRRAAHHVLAERWVRKFCPGADPHILENLVVVTPKLHSRLTDAENCLFEANWLGYRSRLNQLGFRLEVLDRALKAVCLSVLEK
jgi:hypothetical protein